MKFKRFVIETGEIVYQEEVDSANLSPSLREHGRRLLSQAKRDGTASIPLRKGSVQIYLGLPRYPDDPPAMREKNESLKAVGFFCFSEPGILQPVSLSLALSQHCALEDAKEIAELFVKMSALNVAGRAAVFPLGLIDTLVSSRPCMASTMFRLPSDSAIESMVANFPPIFALAFLEEQDNLSKGINSEADGGHSTGPRMELSAVITPETLSTGEAVYVSLCPELDVASQGATREEALANLQEAIEGLLEVGGQAELDRRLWANAGMTSHLDIAVVESHGEAVAA